MGLCASFFIRVCRDLIDILVELNEVSKATDVLTPLLSPVLKLVLVHTHHRDCVLVCVCMCYVCACVCTMRVWVGV